MRRLYVYLILLISLFVSFNVSAQTTKFRATASSIKLGDDKWGSWGTIDRLISFDDDKGIIKVHSDPALVFYKISSESSDERYIFNAIDEYDKPVQIVVEGLNDEMVIYIRYIEFIFAFKGDFLN